LGLLQLSENILIEFDPVAFFVPATWTTDPQHATRAETAKPRIRIFARTTTTPKNLFQLLIFGLVHGGGVAFGAEAGPEGKEGGAEGEEGEGPSSDICSIPVQKAIARRAPKWIYHSATLEVKTGAPPDLSTSPADLMVFLLESAGTSAPQAHSRRDLNHRRWPGNNVVSGRSRDRQRAVLMAANGQDHLAAVTQDLTDAQADTSMAHDQDVALPLTAKMGADRLVVQPELLGQTLEGASGLVSGHQGLHLVRLRLAVGLDQLGPQTDV
jgi:hypothetical protein